MGLDVAAMRASAGVSPASRTFPNSWCSANRTNTWRRPQRRCRARCGLRLRGISENCSGGFLRAGRTARWPASSKGREGNRVLPRLPISAITLSGKTCSMNPLAPSQSWERSPRPITGVQYGRLALRMATNSSSPLSYQRVHQHVKPGLHHSCLILQVGHMGMHGHAVFVRPPR